MGHLPSEQRALQYPMDGRARTDKGLFKRALSVVSAHHSVAEAAAATLAPLITPSVTVRPPPALIIPPSLIPSLPGSRQALRITCRNHAVCSIVSLPCRMTTPSTDVLESCWRVACATLIQKSAVYKGRGGPMQLILKRCRRQLNSCMNESPSTRCSTNNWNIYNMHA